MTRFIRDTLISAISLALIDTVVGGIGFPDFRSVLATAIALGLLNATIKPVLKVLTIPVNVLTFGIVSLLINGLMLNIAVKYSGGEIKSFGMAVLVSVLLTFVNSVVASIFKGK